MSLPESAVHGIFATVKQVWGDNYGAVKLPTYTCAGQQIQMSSFKGYKYMGVSAYSKYPEWALKLADWFTNEQNQTLRLEQQDQGPSNINLSPHQIKSQKYRLLWLLQIRHSIEHFRGLETATGMQ